VRPQLPAWLDGLMTHAERVRIIRNDQSEVEQFVLSVSRAARQGVS
jgi:threonine synthase